MSGHEKRYFKMMASHQAGQKKYLALFDAIAAQKIYDEKELKERFRGEKFLKQFSVAKNYLYDQVLKSLHQYHTKPFKETQSLLRISTILWNKGLYRQAERMLKKALRIAKSTEDYGAVIQSLVSLWNLTRLRSTTVKDFEEKTSELRDELDAVLKTSQQIHGMLELMDRQHSHSMQRSSTGIPAESSQNFYRELLSHPGLSDDRSYDSPLLVSYYHGLRGQAFQQLQDIESSLHEKKEHVKANRTLLQQDSNVLTNYVTSVYNLGTSLALLGRTDEMKEIVEDMRRLSHELSFAKRESAQLFGYMALIELARLHWIEQDSEEKTIPSWILDSLTKHEHYMKEARLFDLRFMICRLLALRAEWPDVLEWSTLILNNTSTKLYTDRQLDIRLMQLIALYELEEDLALDSRLLSLKRWLGKEEIKSYQGSTVRTIEQLRSAESEEQKQSVLSKTAEYIKKEGSGSFKGTERVNPMLRWLGRSLK